MKDFLHKKGIELSLKTYFVTALSFMALGLFSSLIIGLIIRTAGQQIPIPYFEEFLVPMGQLAMDLMGPAIGVAVAYGLKAPRLVLFPAVVVGAAGATLGGPAGAFIAALISTEIGKLVSKETRLDIIVTPFVTIFSGYLIATTIGPVIAGGIDYFGALIMWAVDRQPFVMGILVAMLMGLALTAPISSAAIAFMLGLEGIAAGAATVGCAAQMIGFATSSYRENGFSGFVALGIGTSMLQVPNIVRNPMILIPPTVAGMILAPFATMVFHMVNNPAGAGMGTSGFVGQIMTFTVMGFTWDVFLPVLLLHFIGPAVISLILSEALRKAGLIKFGDMKIEQ
ncbi:PTS transporter subunit IIC [Anaerobacillus isosaccharinicus]|uniref:PTS sugar transporter subunit IIC n=1 Tax=Anaerobacillus isosaccharinicus TaxID=1532552 RepID=A0A1S2KVA9_9BACI|nr:PTS sugar transporter subunit IIC [Anaerobacillus isosaccharinicus]MBA5588017.1 PTS sugar transporter subunit IIC [Anaerobacillus isosaccharinicus]QOY33838.1 PTS sugar transporter subunit IIC [Anaerobacillus isosaccharinicus]